MNKSRALNVLLIVLSVLILALTVSFLTIYNVRHSRELEEKIGPLNDQTRALFAEYDEKTALRKQTIEKYRYYDKFGKSMTTLLFQECTVNLYTDVYLRAMRQYKAIGVYVVTDSEIVGAEGCITYEQYGIMNEAGWTMAVGYPEKIPNGFDSEEYFGRVKQQLDAFGIPFPTVLVFNRENYSQRLLSEAIGLIDPKCVYFNSQDPKCDLSANTIQKADDLLFIPYLFTSKRTPIRSNFEQRLRNGQCISISTRGARTGMSGDTATHDTTVGSLKDIVETIKLTHQYYRSYSDYRNERLKSDTEYLIIKSDLIRQTELLDFEIKNLHKTIINVYADG